MKGNRQKIEGLRKVRVNWEKFDALPREWKDLCRDGITAYSVRDNYVFADINLVREQLQKLEAESTREVYGPDHPNARPPAEGMIRAFSGEPVNPAKRRSTMQTYAFNFNKQTIKSYATKAEAQSAGNSAMLASTPEDFLKFIVTSHEVVALYNKFVPEAPIQKFADKQTAAKRMIALAEAKAQPASSPAAKSEAPKAEASKPEKAIASKPPRAEGSGTRGKKSAFAGKRLFPKVTENPRRAGSHGFRSLAIILASPGIAYEDYEKAGGRRVDLAWDVSHGAVELK